MAAVAPHRFCGGEDLRRLFADLFDMYRFRIAAARLATHCPARFRWRTCWLPAGQHPFRFAEPYRRSPGDCRLLDFVALFGLEVRDGSLAGVVPGTAPVDSISRRAVQRLARRAGAASARTSPDESGKEKGG